MKNLDDSKLSNLDASTLSKALSILKWLKQSESGAVVYGHIESILEEAQSSRSSVEKAYADMLCALLNVIAEQINQHSPSLRTQIKILQLRLKPPLSKSELRSIESYVKTLTEQFGQQETLNIDALKKTVTPLFRAFGVAAEKDSALPKALVNEVVQDEDEPQELKSLTEHGILSPNRHTREMPNQPKTSVRSSRPVHSTHPIPSILDVPKSTHQQATKLIVAVAEYQQFGVMLELYLNAIQVVKDNKKTDDYAKEIGFEVKKLLTGHRDLILKFDKANKFIDGVQIQNQQLQDELNRVRLLSLTDELTGLANRRAFMKRIEDEVGRAKRYGFSLSMTLMDLDKFKSVNDRYGHAAGDTVLKGYAEQVLSMFRHHDLVARYGGEEFAVLLPNTSLRDAEKALRKVQQRAANVQYFHNGAYFSMPTFSAGLSQYKSGELPAAFIERVDTALYEAKKRGRNRVEIADSKAPLGQTSEQPSIQSRSIN